MDEASAWNKVSPFFDTFLECLDFAKDVVLALREDEWRCTVRLPNPPHAGEYDEYGHSLSDALCREHGVESREWYVKLRLTEGLYGDAVFLVSLHVAERPLKNSGRNMKTGGRS